MKAAYLKNKFETNTKCEPTVYTICAWSYKLTKASTMAPDVNNNIYPNTTDLSSTSHML